MGTRVTIKDVAKKAGVSISTVSRVLNKSSYVKKSTFERVEAVISELGYSPNHIARSLSKGTTGIIGAILPDISNPFFPALARGIGDAAVARGYTLILCNTDGYASHEKSSVRALLEKQVDGIVFVTGSSRAVELVREASKACPVAVIDREVQGVSCDMVTVDNYRGSFEMTRHLLNTGHRHIAYITGPMHLSTSRERLRGLRDCLAAAGIERQPLVFNGDFKYDTGYSFAREIIRLGLDVTCVYCANDLMALGAMRSFLDSGLKVPEQMAVAGFDDIAMSSLIRPALTTIAQPAYQMGVIAAEFLLERLDNGKELAPRSKILEPVLVIRDST
jgi:LacI family transcriptional regulator